MQTSLLDWHCRGATGYAAKPNIREIENKVLIYGNKKECWDSNHGLVTGPQHSFVVFQSQGKGKNYVRKIQCQSMEIKRKECWLLVAGWLLGLNTLYAVFQPQSKSKNYA